jgi:hypothetical protein
MISRKLSIAIIEAIQQHADRNCGGKIDLREALAALGDVASDLLADITDHNERMSMHGRFCRATAQAALQKAADQSRHITEHLQ